MRELTFELFKTFLHGGSSFEGRESCRVLINTILYYVKEEDIIEFYPKGLFVSDSIQVLVFKNDGMIVFDTNKIHSTIKAFKYKNLVGIVLTQSESDYRKKSVEIKFSDEAFFLQSDGDTNSTWGARFADKITNIFKQLSKYNDGGTITGAFSFVKGEGAMMAAKRRPSLSYS